MKRISSFAIRQAAILAIKQCEHCNQRFDVSLPDSDEHRYVCEGCDLVICWDCKEMDKNGNDWCPDCAENPNIEWAQHD